MLSCHTLIAPKQVESLLIYSETTEPVCKRNSASLLEFGRILLSDTIFPQIFTFPEIQAPPFTVYEPVSISTDKFADFIKKFLLLMLNFLL